MYLGVCFVLCGAEQIWKTINMWIVWLVTNLTSNVNVCTFFAIFFCYLLDLQILGEPRCVLIVYYIKSSFWVWRNGPPAPGGGKTSNFYKQKKTLRIPNEKLIWEHRKSWLFFDRIFFCQTKMVVSRQRLWVFFGWHYFSMKKVVATKWPEEQFTVLLMPSSPPQ